MKRARACAALLQHKRDTDCHAEIFLENSKSQRKSILLVQLSINKLSLQHFMRHQCSVCFFYFLGNAQSPLTYTVCLSSRLNIRGYAMEYHRSACSTTIENMPRIFHFRWGAHESPSKSTSRAINMYNLQSQQSHLLQWMFDKTDVLRVFSEKSSFCSDTAFPSRRAEIHLPGVVDLLPVPARLAI